MNDTKESDQTPAAGNDLYQPYDGSVEDEINAAAGIPPEPLAGGEPPVDVPPSGGSYFEDDEPDDEPAVRFGIVRPGEDRWVAGVARGLAAATGIDVRWVRLAFAFATIFGGAGVVLYVAGWLLMPAEGESEAIGMRLIRNSGSLPTWIGFLLLLGGGMIVAGIVGIDAGLVLAVGLLVGGYALYRGDVFVSEQRDALVSEPGAPPQSSATPPGAPPTSYVWQVREPGPPKPPRPRSYLGRLTIGSLLLTLGLMGALDYAGIATPTTRHYGGVMLLVIGAGLLVGTFRGRARSLIVLGALLLPPATIMHVADFDLGTDVQELAFHPISVSQIRDRYALPAGRLLVDLTGVPFNGETVVLDLDIGIGDLDVYVPANVQVETMASMDIGDVRVDGMSSSGPGAAINHAVPGDNGTIVIDAKGRFGSINVSRVHSDAFTVPIIERLIIDGESRFIQPLSPIEIPGSIVLSDGELDLNLAAMDDIQVATLITGNGTARINIPPGAGFSISTSQPIEGAVESALVFSDGATWVYEREGMGSIDIETIGPILIVTEEGE
ncbi:MAG: PspC domain-containing protein [Acidimicrobiia bacterium]|nr:PspC domain-containing protein [Acidimicrobiia bacterium]